MPRNLALLGVNRMSTANRFIISVPVVVPIDTPGLAIAHTTTIPASGVSGGPFPPQPPGMSDEKGVNKYSPPVPLTPNVLAPDPPMVPQTSVQPAPPVGGTSGTGQFLPLIFKENQSTGLSTNGDTTAEPSGASGSGVVFVSFNHGVPPSAGYSINGGPFTQLDPTTIFPDDEVGFCCDQVVQYLPSIDRFIWLIQGKTIQGVQAGKGYRFAVASPSGIKQNVSRAWTYWNLTPDHFGMPAGVATFAAFDYPDLSVGTNYLYLSWNVTCNPQGAPGCQSGREVVRIKLSEIQALTNPGAPCIPFPNCFIAMDYFNDGLNGLVTWSAHLSQDTQDEVFWAGHIDNRTLRVFYWPENERNPSYTCSDPRCDIQDIQISPWEPGLVAKTLSSVTPDGQDWMDKLRDFPANAILGVTRAPALLSIEVPVDGLWLAWSAGPDSNFPEPHVEIVTREITRPDGASGKLALIQQVQIWNSDYAFAYPALATMRCGLLVGLSLEGGGGLNYEESPSGSLAKFSTSDINHFGRPRRVQNDQQQHGDGPIWRLRNDPPGSIPRRRLIERLRLWCQLRPAARERNKRRHPLCALWHQSQRLLNRTCRSIG